MSRIVIIRHKYGRAMAAGSLLSSLIPHWTSAGHAVLEVEGTNDLPEADVAILHVDLSVVPSAYIRAAERYPVVLNGAARDIRKRKVSRHLLARNDAWEGPVLVKTDLNCGGVPEWQTACEARAAGATVEASLGQVPSFHRPYAILPALEKVTDEVWNDESLVVERFLPEVSVHGFWLRAWVFLGAEERCTRYLAADPIVKASMVLAREPASVPDDLRAERKRLGFDYGKFDFVVRDGKAILFDANKTPSGLNSTV